jgi:hypothetical protein
MEITQIQFGVLALEDDTKQIDQIVLTYKRNQCTYVVSQNMIFLGSKEGFSTPTLRMSEPVTVQLPGHPVSISTANVGDLYFFVSNYFSDNRIQLNAFSKCSKTGKWVHRGQTKFVVSNSDDQTVVDVSEAVVDCFGSATRSTPSILKCVIATRGVYSYNVAIELNPPTVEESSL